MKATNTCSKRKLNGAKPEESLSAKRQYMQMSELNKSSIPTKVSRDLPGKISANNCINSVNFDTRARDESSANRENATATVHMCKETSVVMSNIQDSTIQLQMISCKRVHSGTSEHADRRRTNLIGAHYNVYKVSASHPTKFAIQFPKVPTHRESGNVLEESLSYHQCTWMNHEIGAPYNGLASYLSKFQISFQKSQRKGEHKIEKVRAFIYHLL